MMAFFGAIGKFEKGSGFEEITYQTDLCTSGNIGGVLSGNQYNRCRMVDEILNEALEHLFLKEYLPDIRPSFLSREEGSPHNIEYSLQENKFMQQYRAKGKGIKWRIW